LRSCRGAIRRLDDSVGYKDWKCEEIKKRLEELEPYRWDKIEGEDGWRPTQYKRLEIEMIALRHEGAKYDRSGNDLDLSRRHWAGNPSVRSALRKQVSSEAKTRFSKLGGRVKGALWIKGSTGSSISMLPMTSSQAGP